MNSLTAILSEISSQLGVELISEENTADKANPYSIRFAGLDTNKSFSLVMSRSWKTTQIQFRADPFAGDIIQFLCDQINTDKDKFGAVIEANKSTYSSINLEIDGLPFFENSNRSPNSRSLVFEVETLTTESSLRYGLLNEKEENLVKFFVSIFASLLPINSVSFRNADEVLGYPEGAVSQVFVNKYERDPRNRRIAISIHGKSCLACGFNFKDKYGDLGDEYIIVHHVVPVSQMGNEYVVEPAQDLVTLCANCHAMVHRQEPPITVDDLRKIISSTI